MNEMPSIAARPFAFEYELESIGLVVIDMQPDFLEPGGFGAALGNDASLLAETVEPTAKLLALFRKRGWPIIHTREAHKPDLSNCPPAKRLRGDGDFLRIGDEGPMGRILISGEPGWRSCPRFSRTRARRYSTNPARVHSGRCPSTRY